MPVLHSRKHPTYVEGCYGCRLASIQVAVKEEAKVTAIKDKQLSKDLDAYKRLRHNGLQPRSIDGSHRAEAEVTSQLDFTLGRVIPKNEYSRVQEGMAMAKEMNMSMVSPD